MPNMPIWALVQRGGPEGPSPDPASHEATHHLLRVLRAPGVGKADEGAVDSDPSTPLQLEEVGGQMG